MLHNKEIRDVKRQRIYIYVCVCLYTAYLEQIGSKHITVMVFISVNLPYGHFGSSNYHLPVPILCNLCLPRELCLVAILFLLE